MRKTQKTTARSYKTLSQQTKETTMFGNKKEAKQADLELFTIYDSKSQSYDKPTFAPNKNVLIREVINLFRDPEQSKNMLLTNAEDYSIFKIGSYSKVTGELTAHNLEHVANLHDLKAIAVDDRQPVINYQGNGQALYPT